MRIYERVLDVARRNPQARALSTPSGVLSYRDLVAAVERRAAEYAGGEGTVRLEGGDPIGFVVGCFAAGRAGRGAVAHPASAPATLRSLREETLEHHPPPAGSTVFFSSGSVGPGRAVPLTEANLAAAALAFESWGELSDSDRLAVGLSPAQILAFVRGALNGLSAGAEVIFFVPRRDPLGEAARLGATLVLLPSALVKLAARHRSRPPLRALQCGGGEVAPKWADAVELNRGVPVRLGYGMTESAGLATRQPIARPRRAGTTGLPAPRLTVEIIGPGGRRCRTGEPGEIRLSGEAVFSGYLVPEEPSPFDAEGRLRTGDVGVFDELGELAVRGRLAFAISIGDRILCAEEVEAAIAEHPAVADVAAAPVEQAFGVLVVGRAGAMLEPSVIRAHAARRLPAFARPRRILGVAELPRNAAGKIDRAAATRWLTEPTARG